MASLFNNTQTSAQNPFGATSTPFANPNTTNNATTTTTPNPYGPSSNPFGATSLLPQRQSNLQPAAPYAAQHQQAAAQQQHSVAAPTDNDIINAFVQQMAKAYDANDYRMCSFKHVFFDDLSHEGANGKLLPPPPELLQRKRAEHLAASDTTLWMRADAANPDPGRFVPVQVTGFQKLHERHRTQQQLAEQISRVLEKSRTEARAIAREREATTLLRFRHYQARQLHLAHRVVRLMAALETHQIARTSAAGGEQPLAPAERGWVRDIERLAAAVRAPGQDIQSLGDLVAELRARDESISSAPDGTEEIAAQLDMPALRELLAQQQDALRRLVELQQRLVMDVQLILSTER